MEEKIIEELQTKLNKLFYGKVNIWKAGCYMARYVSVRGWLECEKNQVEKIRKIISEYDSEGDLDSIMTQESMDFYNKGWCFPEEMINWTAYVFYGADVKEYCLSYLKEEIKEILKENTKIEGMFFLKYEDGEEMYWKIVDSQLVNVINDKTKFKDNNYRIL